MKNYLTNYTIPKEKINYEDALKESKKYFNGGDLEAEVFLNKYALQDSDGNLYEKTPDDMHRRLAKQFSRIEEKYPNPRSEEEIYQSLKGFKYIIPQGSPMAAIGNPFQLMSLSNCFFIKNDSDSYGGIMRTDEQLTHLMKRRAGVGTDISHLRPEGTSVKNAAKTSTGAVSFMERYSNTTREIAQSGRRGACLLSLNGLHPDVQKFIDIKMDETKVTGANISIKMPDELMEAIRRGDTKFTLRFPTDVPIEEAKYTKEVNPQDIWNKLIFNAWSRAEPGCLFWDTVTRESLPDCYTDLGFKTEGTNPCGEITLASHDSCRLTLLNLYSYVVNPFKSDAYFDFDKFKEMTILAQRLMDDIVDLELEHISAIIEKIKADPEPDEIKWVELKLWKDIKDKAIRGRRTGLGITAMGDMLAAMGLRYGTDEANAFAEKVMRFKKHAEYESSMLMAQERGTFPIWGPVREEGNPFLKRVASEDESLYKKLQAHGRRNIAISTIAPAGTVSLMTQTSSGIENVFSIVYYRNRKINPGDKTARVDFVDKVGDSWQEYPVFHPTFLTYLEVNGISREDAVNLSKEEINEWIKKSPYYKATSNDTDWVKKVEMQGMAQKHIDHSISVTTNLPENIPVDTVKDVYMKAWEVGCKGVTIYRDGSRSGVLNTKSNKDSQNKIIHNNAPKRPKYLPADVYHVTAKGSRWTVVVGLLEDFPYEVFAVSGEFGNHKETGVIKKVKRGVYDLLNKDEEIWKENFTENNTDEEASLTRLISTALRHGAKIDFIVEQLNKSEGTIVSFSKAVARTLKKYVNGNLSYTDNFECGCDDPELQHSEGCITCLKCGKSKCT